MHNEVHKLLHNKVYSKHECLHPQLSIQAIDRDIP